MDTNNAVWAWLDTHDHGDAADPIIHAAHASYFHWDHVGSDINRARAASLVANVHSTLGNADLAEALARQCLELLETAGDDATDWDLAFGLDSLARSQAAAASAEAVAHKAKARAAGDAIVDPEDKAVFDNWFANGNWHGLS